jgi:hypothetical protein
MHMTTYREAVEAFQPVIDPLFAALIKGLEEAQKDHASKEIDRKDDPHFYLHIARRIACRELAANGLTAINETSSKPGRPLLGMSGILIPFKGLAVKVLHTQLDKHQQDMIPIPGQSRDRQAFWRQEAGSALPGLETDNLLLLWRDDLGKLVEPMYLVRPLGGDHRRGSLVFQWKGKLERQMAHLRASDLDELQPDVEYRQLGDGGAG